MGVGFYGNSEINDGTYQLTYSIDNANRTLASISSLVRDAATCFLSPQLRSNEPQPQERLSGRHRRSTELAETPSVLASAKFENDCQIVLGI